MELRLVNDDLKKIAKEELNEDDNRIEDDVNSLREWLKKQPHLIAREEKQWLVMFLRGCKFSLEKTKEKLDMYYTVRNLMPECLQNRDPFSPEIQALLEIGPCLPLPKLPSPGAPRFILMRTGDLDGSKTKLDDMFKLNLMIHDILLNEDDNFVIAGEITIVDMKAHSVSFMMSRPVQLKKVTSCFQNAYPLRIKKSHFINSSPVLETFYRFLRTFLNEKIKKRMSVHSVKDWEELEKIVPRDILPDEYGGNGGKLSDITAHWKKKVESYSEWFKADAQYRTDEEKRVGEPRTTETVFGVAGSFRQLTIS